jgi:hypothetical protein
LLHPLLGQAGIADVTVVVVPTTLSCVVTGATPLCFADETVMLLEERWELEEEDVRVQMLPSPTHVQPASIWQNWLQPSPLRRSPSSHCSPLSTLSLPHTGAEDALLAEELCCEQTSEHCGQLYNSFVKPHS